jgi:hypothetical protein
VNHLGDVVAEDSTCGKHQKQTLQRKTNLQWQHYFVTILVMRNNCLAGFAVPSQEEFQKKEKKN